MGKTYTRQMGGLTIGTMLGKNVEQNIAHLFTVYKSFRLRFISSIRFTLEENK